MPPGPRSLPRKGGPFCLVTGRWDNTLALVDLAAACDPANHGTPRAIVSRIRVTPDIIDEAGRTVPASGQPVNLAIPPAGGFAYVVNHSGRVSPAAAAAFQHGHPGLVAVVDLARACDPVHDGTLGAVDGFIATETAGPVGCAVTDDGRELYVGSAEAPGCEDGGERITLVDLASRRILRQIPQRVAPRPDGSRPIPARAGPDPRFGAYPCTNGIALAAIGEGYLFTANGGTDDVSVIDLARARAGRADAELARIPVETGPFGIGVSPDMSLVAVANRECARTGREGSTISLIDAKAAIAGSPDAERARITVGSDDPGAATRPFAVAFTPDGAHVLASCFRSNTLSLVDIAAALTGRPAERHRLHLAAPGGGPGRPRGIVVTEDGRHAVVTGGAKAGPGSSCVFVIDVAAMIVAGTVTQIGNESYMLSLVPLG
jgi:DNA-binding beta-propeller fold protein YncE